ncbi:GNAT family N-acetyltransferase [Kribbella yunnanensis]
MRSPAIRRAGEADLDAVSLMLTGLSDLSLYFRFQAGVGRPPRPALLLRMLCPNGASWVADRDDEVVGHAMWAWVAGSPGTAELAAVISDAEQHRGLGVRMLAIAAADAIAAGATHFLFVVSSANDASLRMVRRRWPDATVERDGALLMFHAPARVPAQMSQARSMAVTSTSAAAAVS